MKIKSTNEKGQIEGYASVFNKLDLNGDIIEQNAFTKSIEEFSQGKKDWRRLVDAKGCIACEVLSIL